MIIFVHINIFFSISFSNAAYFFMIYTNYFILFMNDEIYEIHGLVHSSYTHVASLGSLLWWWSIINY